MEVKIRFWYGNDKEKFFRIFTLDEILNGDPFEVLSDQPLYRDYKMLDRSDAFSGVEDEDGKELYEGDNVYSDQWNPKTQEITFDRGGFCLKYEGAEYYSDIKYAEKMKLVQSIGI